MDWEQQFLQHALYNLTPSERHLLSGQRKRDLVGFVSDVETSQSITPAHMAYFQQLVGDFAAVSQIHAVQRSDIINFDNNLLAEGSTFEANALAFCPEDHHGKSLWALNHFKSVADPVGFLAIARPSPVKWYVDHILERSDERGNKPVEMSGTMFLKHNAVAMAMLRIFEEEHSQHKDVWHPFILPERNGILLGHTMHATEIHTRNRISIFTSPDWNRFSQKLGRYERTPDMIMTVRTFYGFDEMTPAMQAMRLKLLPFYDRAKSDALSLELETYTHAKGSTDFEEHPRFDDYCDAVLALSDIMQSEGWRRAAILPLHLRNGGQEARPNRWEP